MVSASADEFGQRMAHRAVAVETELPDPLDDLLLISIIEGWRQRATTQSPESTKVGAVRLPRER
jgi:hypothetical protein